MIRCACLLKLNDTKDKILLVRARDNQKLYLPSGKIENSESAEDCLIREIKEELGIDLHKSSVKHRLSWQDIAYGVNDTVELCCFTASFEYVINFVSI